MHDATSDCTLDAGVSRRERPLREPEAMIVTIMLRDGVPLPREAPWLKPGVHYYGEVILIADREAAVRIHGPNGQRLVMSTRDVRRIADDWPDH